MTECRPSSMSSRLLGSLTMTDCRTNENAGKTNVLAATIALRPLNPIKHWQHRSLLKFVCTWTKPKCIKVKHLQKDIFHRIGKEFSMHLCSDCICMVVCLHRSYIESTVISVLSHICFVYLFWIWIFFVLCLHLCFGCSVFVFASILYCELCHQCVITYCDQLQSRWRIYICRVWWSRSHPDHYPDHSHQPTAQGICVGQIMPRLSRLV